MSSTDDSYSMTSSLPSSLDQTPLSSLSAASSYASLVNCDETLSIHHDSYAKQQQHLEKKSKRNSIVTESNKSCNSDSSNKLTNGSNNSAKRTCYSTLQNRHVNKLCSILEEPIEIHGQGNFPTLNIVSKDFLIELRRAFHVNQIDIKDVRLNGGAASYVLTNDKAFSYSDIDFIFRCDLSSESTWTQIKTTVCECLARQISPNSSISSSSQSSFSPVIIQAAYVEKVVRVINPSNNDSWALMSLCNVNGQNIELKFVDRMKRQFQFSVDSFQIQLDPLLDYYEQLAKYQQTTNKKQSYYQQYNHHSKQQHDYRSGKNNRYLYRLPAIQVECVYGSFDSAVTHLNRRLIVTTSPERIRGGGLLKYCLLLTRGYRPYNNGIESWQLEKLMCSRFFIDYADINEQEYKLLAFLTSHFPNDDGAKYRYLLQLRLIIERSTVCLMAHERNLTLTLIAQLAIDYYYRLYEEYSGYNLNGETTTAEVTVPNSITIDVIYHNELDEWKTLHRPPQKAPQSQQEN